MVCFAGGMSRWRVISPSIRLAVICALLTLVVNLWVTPWCYRETRDELFKIKTDLVSSLIRDGEFTPARAGPDLVRAEHRPPGPAAQRVHQPGETERLSHHLRAKFGRIVKRGGEPALVLNQGSNQQFNAQGVLTYTTFVEYVLDLTPLPEHRGGGSLQKLGPLSARTALPRH